MASSSKSEVEVEVEVKCSADKFWRAVMDSADLFPKIFPDRYKSIDILEGDGKSAGTIRLLRFGQGVPIATFSKERIEAVDDANRQISYSVIDGGPARLYKAFNATLQVVPKGEGALVKWCLEYEKKLNEEEVHDADFIQKTAVRAFKVLDAYLLEN